MDIFLIIDWLRYLIVRLFIFMGILSLTPILILLLLEPLVYIFRLVESYIPSSVAQKKPLRQATMSIQNLAAIAADSSTVQAEGLRSRERGMKLEEEEREEEEEGGERVR